MKKITKKIFLITVLLFLLLSIDTRHVFASGDLVAWWKFDESSGVPLDVSGSRLIVSNNNVTYSAGKTNNAAIFNGTNADFRGTGPVLANRSFSISAWLYANNLSADQVWLNLGDNSSDDEALHLRVTTTGAMRFGFFNDDLDTADGAFSSGAWHNVMYTYNSDTRSRSIYLDGILKASDTANANFSGTKALTIGSWIGDEYWHGKIDEVKIYTRVLTSSEISDLAAGNSGPDTTMAAPSTALNWQETRPAGDTDIYWSKAKTSRDGHIVLAGGQSGARLYYSTTNGTTWTETQPTGDSDENWFTLGVSSDGHTLLAGAYGGRVYISTDEGNTWTDTQAAGDVSYDWQTGALSGDGRTIIAGINNGRLYISHDAGTTWTETRPAGDTDAQWLTSAVNDTGDTLLAGSYSGRLYRSINGGTTWNELQLGGNTNLNWNVTSISKNGQIMLAGVDDGTEGTGKIYSSYDHGNTWNVNTPGGITTEEWRIATMTDDGQTMMAGYGDGTYGRLWLSQDSGFSWKETRPAGDAEHFWSAGAVSGDGYTFIAGVGYSSGTRRLYTAYLPRPAQQPLVSPQKTSCSDPVPTGTPDLFQIDTTSTQAKLYFTPTANADRYIVSFGYATHDMRFGAEFIDKAQGVKIYTLNYLAPQTTYYVRVRGGNVCATGEWGNEMKFKTTSKGNNIIKKFYK